MPTDPWFLMGPPDEPPDPSGLGPSPRSGPHHQCARCGRRIGLAVTPPPGAVCATCASEMQPMDDDVRAKHDLIRMRFEDRFLIHLNRIRVWFQAVEFATLGPSVQQSSFITPLAWCLNAWPADLEDPYDRCRIDYSLHLWHDDRSSSAIWMDLTIYAPGREVLLNFRPGKARVEFENTHELERRFRQLTSDDSHAMIHETLSDHYGRELVASPPPRTHGKVTP